MTEKNVGKTFTAIRHVMEFYDGLWLLRSSKRGPSKIDGRPIALPLAQKAVSFSQTYIYLHDLGAMFFFLLDSLSSDVCPIEMENLRPAQMS